uniref:Uncharacterized protein n=1 Tax=Amphimedon queenslandica TaxID=400682 RepID=A0A1X7TLT5_AMPQE
YGTRSSVGLGVLRACIGIGTGAMVGSVAFSDLIPYNHIKTAAIVMGGLIGAFIDAPEYIVVKDHLADVIDLLAGNAPVITQFSNHLFSSGLIPKEVHLNPKSSPLDRATQLINSVSCTIGAHSDPNSVFHGLVSSLQKVELTDMARKLQQSLGGISHSQVVVPLAAVDQSPTVIQLSSKDEVARNIDKLYDQFTDLVTDLRTQFEELISEGKIKLIQVTRQAADYLRRRVTSLQVNSIDELFDSLRPHCDFLNCSLLRKLTNKFLAGDELQLSLSQYIDKMDKLLESSQLKHIRSTVKERLSFLPAPTTSEHTVLIIFKLHDRWEEMTLENFKRVLIHYFGSNADLFSHIYFDYGSLIVKMLIPTSIFQSVKDVLIARRSSMNRIGIFEVVIRPISGEMEFNIDDAIDFEQSLMDSVKENDDFDAIMLLKLGADHYSISANAYNQLSMIDIDLPLTQETNLNERNEIPGTKYGQLSRSTSQSSQDAYNARLNRVFYIIFPAIIIYWFVNNAGTKLMEDLFVFAVSSCVGGSFGAFVGTEVFDKYKSVRHNAFHPGRITNRRVIIDSVCQFLGIGGIYVIFSGALIYTSYFFDVTQYIPIFIGSITGAVYTMTTAPEPKPIQSNYFHCSSNPFKHIFRYCFGVFTGLMAGIVTGAVVGSFGILNTDIISYKHGFLRAQF